jgi:cell division protein FtsW
MTGSTTFVGRPGSDPDQQASRNRHPTGRPINRRQARQSLKRRRAAARGPKQQLGEPPIQFYVIAAVMAVLTMLGLVMVLSSSAVKAINNGQNGWGYFKKQLLWAVLGIAALFITVKVPYTKWRNFVKVGLVGSFGLMLAVFVPGLGRNVNGARNWLNLGPFGGQPSEIMKLALLLYAADLLARRLEHIANSRRTLRPILIILGAACLLVLAQRDLGNGIVMAIIVMAVSFFAGVPLRQLTVAGAGMTVAGLGFVLSESYRLARWTSFLNLEANKGKSGYQVWQSLVAVASGGLTGAGVGAGKAKWGFIPELHTDFIFALIAEEMGLFGVVVVCALFALLGYAGIQVALRAKDTFGMLVAGGVTAWLMAQAVINIMGVTGMMPLTGLTLPFVSFGGTSLLVTMSASGLLLNVARNSG